MGKCQFIKYHIRSRLTFYLLFAFNGIILVLFAFLFEEAARLVFNQGRASTSYLQTALGMGFAKSARVMSQLEAAGIVGPQEGSKNRAVLVSTAAELDSILEKYR